MRTYGYDLNGRQTSVAYPTGLILTYAYDSVSNRTSILDPDGGTTAYSYDGQNLLQERDGSLAKTVQYTDFPGYWGGLSSQRRGGTSGFYGFDSQSGSR